MLSKRVQMKNTFQEHDPNFSLYKLRIKLLLQYEKKLHLHVYFVTVHKNALHRFLIGKTSSSQIIL